MARSFFKKFITKQNHQAVHKHWPGIIEAYKHWLPVTKKTPIITLQEGATPLIELQYINKIIGKDVKVYAKYDGLNPTGSFKDRGMTMAISKAKENGTKVVICASTGNTSASAAAYAKKGGMRSFVLIPEGYVAQGKLAQALVYGAEVLAIKGNFDEALKIVQNISNKFPVTLVNSVNPYRLQGQKTAAFEIIESLGEAPDWLCIPMGNAGNITAYWMGFNEYYIAGISKKLPKMMGFQAKGSAPLVLGKTIDNPDTIATAIRIGNPVNKENAYKVKKESKGKFTDVTDEEIINAYKILGKEEGIFCEPASASSVAGLLKVKESIPSNSKIVCVLTGNGLKDPDCAIKNNDAVFKEGISPDIKTVAENMGF
ncbi:MULTISPECIES: threonine synthase [Prochlorococcus]|uniref:Threonine synthase n=1 Tax=Prochlorococcus marinus (strain SARG / CCMP1375 / SS120) TaxID=167539 RepID=Q7V9E8_PROMA|nr:MULTISPECIES: threonine synthase [Prochlorococcus]AAQ00929.1 Threonine synthase [Prochlorococcus marinus subsp. marinus str. CCMP1375]KGG14421.1 Threonine synthase [Prochlorococcus marinus str. LG]KGG20235.1 Threonine synthase [Prochlorococcus marinus str. SS2]KGG23822.1 Threonine synthase [Prochlorococcus marinus str. SS35]KGG33095.1 Threonine synthase [Prochlorococcus marinus str. SS51]